MKRLQRCLLALLLGWLALGATGSQGAAWWLQLGDAARARYDYSQALAAYEAAAAWDPRAGLPHLRLGQIYARQGRASLAYDALWQAHLREPQAVEALVALGDLALAEGIAAEAVAWYGRAREVAPQDARIAEAHGLALLAGARPGEALAAFREALLLAPGADRVRYHVGLLLAAEDRAAARGPLLAVAGGADAALAARAADLLSALDGIDRAQTPAARSALLGLAYLRQEQWPLAYDALREASEAGGDQGEVLAYLGYALYQLGREGEAVTTLRRALAVDPDNGQAHHFLAMAYLRLGWPEDALAHLDAAYGADRSSPAIAADIARAYADAGAYDWAESWHEQAVKLSGGAADYLLLQAAFHVNHVYHVREKGLPAAEQGLALLPPDAPPEEVAAACAILGRGQHLAGQPERAEASLRRALSLDPDSAQVWFYLAEVAAQQGRWAEARLAYQRAADVDAEGSWRERASRELERLPVGE